MDPRGDGVHGLADRARGEPDGARPGLRTIQDAQAPRGGETPIVRPRALRTSAWGREQQQGILHERGRVRDDGSWLLRTKRGTERTPYGPRQDSPVDHCGNDNYDDSAREPDDVRQVPQWPREARPLCPCSPTAGEECPVCNFMGPDSYRQDPPGAYALPSFVFDQGWTWPF